MTRAYLSLGSNLGDREVYLRAALDALRQGPSTTLVAVSRIYETEPVEVKPGQPEYLNCVAQVECGLPTVELLRFCQGVEAGLGRERKGEKEPRTVDVDILLFGDEVLDEPALHLPHRGVTRAFNLAGLADLAPGMYIPGRGTVRELLAGADLGGVREYREVEGLC